MRAGSLFIDRVTDKKNISHSKEFKSIKYLGFFYFRPGYDQLLCHCHNQVTSGSEATADSCTGCSMKLPTNSYFQVIFIELQQLLKRIWIDSSFIKKRLPAVFLPRQMNYSFPCFLWNENNSAISFSIKLTKFTVLNLIVLSLSWKQI